MSCSPPPPIVKTTLQANRTTLIYRRGAPQKCTVDGRGRFAPGGGKPLYTHCKSWPAKCLADGRTHHNNYIPLVQHLPPHAAWSAGQQPLANIEFRIIYTNIAHCHHSTGTEFKPFSGRKELWDNGSRGGFEHWASCPAVEATIVIEQPAMLGVPTMRPFINEVMQLSLSLSQKSAICIYIRFAGRDY